MSTEALAPMGLFARYLSLWVALCIVAGIVLGHAFPGAFQVLASWEVQRINLPVAALVWLMIVPMLLKVDFAQLSGVRRQTRGIGITLLVNWAIKPFSMAVLGWLFVRHVFAAWLPADQQDAYMAGLILLAAAPCTAMVFVWSRLCGGEPNFTLAQVALNDTIMIVAFAPIVALLLGVASIMVPWGTLLLSVLLYIVVPVVLAQLWRRQLLRQGGHGAFDATLCRIDPWSMGALLTTLVLLFGFQGEAIVAQPVVILLLAVPIVVQVYLNAGIAYGLSRWARVPHCVAGPAALIGASNFFELAVATAISIFGLRSGAALATVVGVLVEVPVMLSVVQLVRRTAPWFAQDLTHNT
ncbi:ACR3 family arsenite efflux transporter [Rhodanobacter sp. DHG33]|uniref:ACR3 family arsenite efflux transporter n=1 Tax=Rhodanobacter sp. DHG33 TaxID=2775921 RepID=UPI00177B7F24|nr:ACR3 family arsenite efflux transporter [Rhodanobacter sp. DHG33]MBD8897899.1 ACR3 family arsenite efflux transporter [Rhodanobacter sp. DHG33]